MPGLLGKIFGAPSGKLLSEEEQQTAERQAVMDMGLSLMANSMPTSFNEPAKSLTQAIALGVMSGRGSYKRYAESTRAAATATDIESIMSGPMSLATLQDAYQRAIAGGDIETARTVGPLIQSMLTAEASAVERPPNLQFREDPQTGNLVALDPGSGQKILEYLPGTGQLNPVQKKTAADLTHKFMTNPENVKLYDVANSYKRVAVAAQALMGEEQKRMEAKASGQEYHPPIAATLEIISSFARLLDPGSVVKTEEYLIVSRVGGMMDHLKSWMKMLKDGTMRGPIAEQLLMGAIRQANAQRSSWTRGRDQTWLTGDRQGLTPEDLPFLDPFVEAFNAIGINMDEALLGDPGAFSDMDADIEGRAPLVTPVGPEEPEDARTDYQKRIDAIIAGGTSARTGGF